MWPSQSFRIFSCGFGFCLLPGSSVVAVVADMCTHSQAFEAFDFILFFFWWLCSFFWFFFTGLYVFYYIFFLGFLVLEYVQLEWLALGTLRSNEIIFSNFIFQGDKCSVSAFRCPSSFTHSKNIKGVSKSGRKKPNLPYGATTAVAGKFRDGNRDKALAVCTYIYAAYPAILSSSNHTIHQWTQATDPHTWHKAQINGIGFIWQTALSRIIRGFDATIMDKPN